MSCVMDSGTPWTPKLRSSTGYSLSMLVDREMTETAAVLARSMATEDGVESACSAFYKHLPLESMLCDVSLFRGEHRLAQVLAVD